jgi:hypothetical protein
MLKKIPGCDYEKAVSNFRFSRGEHKILGSDGDIKLVCLIIILSPEY